MPKQLKGKIALNDFEVIKFVPSEVMGSRSDDRPALKWMKENGSRSKKKVMFEGVEEIYGRTIHFALLRGMKREEVQEIYNDRRFNMKEDVGYYWGFLPTDRNIFNLPDYIEEGVENIHPDLLGNVLGGVGEAPFLFKFSF